MTLLRAGLAGMILFGALAAPLYADSAEAILQATGARGGLPDFLHL
jgi:hypothetical protein